MGKIKKLIQLIRKRAIILSMIIILSAGFGVRLYKISNPLADWHSWRQADTASVSLIYVQRGIDLLQPRYFDISPIQTGYHNPEGYRFVEFPMYNAIHAFLAVAIPQISFEVWGRLVSIFSALITAVALFGFGRRTISSWGGVAAAFFYLFIPFNIYFTRVILPEPMGVMWVSLSLWMFAEYIHSGKKRPLFLSAIAFSLAMLIKPFAIFYTLPMIYMYLRKKKLRKVLRDFPLLIAIDIALIPFLLWRAWMNVPPNLVGIPHFAWAFNGDGIRFRPAFWRWIFGERLGRLILGMWGLVPFTFGLLAANKKNKVIFFALLGMFLYVSTIATASVRHDYYQSFAIPVIALCLAQGSIYMWEAKEFGKRISKIILGFTVFMMLGMGWYQAREYYIINHYEIVTAGQAADRLLPKDAKVIAPYNGDTAFLYQTKRFGWPVVDRDIMDMVNELGADYYISVNKGDTDTTNFKKRFKTVDESATHIIYDLRQPL